MKELIGKVVTKLLVSDDEQYLMFCHPDGSNTIYETYGDCCSETWFADIVGATNLFQRVRSGEINTIRDVVELELPPIQDSRCRQDSDAHYGIKITTDWGTCFIVYRNSSNGYYGGEIQLCTNPSPEIVWKEITEYDWRA